jgi:hypothetical protein
LSVVDSERARFETPQPDSVVMAEKILELAKKGPKFSTNRRVSRAAKIAVNGAIELHVR